MKAKDVVLQLYSALPNETDKFTDNLSVSSITSVGNTATATTAANHGLSTGALVNVFGAKAPISISSMTRIGTQISVETDADHDLTFGFQQTVEIQGATESEFNGVFELMGVQNRRNFTLMTVDSGATDATGSPLLIDGSAYGYNGLFNIVVTGLNTFTYTLPVALTQPATGTIQASVGFRISAAASIDRAIASYTKQEMDDFWVFVVLGSVTASKNRQILNDSIDTQTSGTDWRQKLIHRFSIFVVVPAIDSVSGRQQRDDMEDVAVALFKSLLGVKFDNGFSQRDEFQTVFDQHLFREYDSATYVHEFMFQTVSEVTNDDTSEDPFSVAFRDIGFSMTNDVGDQPLTVTINLDDLPL